jgi:hypothetical protein
VNPSAIVDDAVLPSCEPVVPALPVCDVASTSLVANAASTLSEPVLVGASSSVNTHVVSPITEVLDGLLSSVTATVGVMVPVSLQPPVVSSVVDHVANLEVVDQVSHIHAGSLVVHPSVLPPGSVAVNHESMVESLLMKLLLCLRVLSPSRLPLAVSVVRPGLNLGPSLLCHYAKVIVVILHPLRMVPRQMVILLPRTVWLMLRVNFCLYVLCGSVGILLHIHGLSLFLYFGHPVPDVLARANIPAYLIKKLPSFYASVIRAWLVLRGMLDHGIWIIPCPSVDPFPVAELTACASYSLLSRSQHVKHRSLAKFRDLGIPVQGSPTRATLRLW